MTGGSGYIGAHVCRLLRDRGDTVVVVDDFVTGIRERVAEFAQLELSLAEPGAADAVAAFAREHAVDAVIHFAGRKQVPESVAKPLMYWNDNVAGLAAVLQACESVGIERFLFSSSAAVYGDASGHVTEDAPCHPVNPYGAAKAYAHLMTGVYRSRDLHAVSAILYNHDSPRRPAQFVTRKITAGVAAISRGEASHLALGNLDARRDWGWAPDYVDAMVRAARSERATDYVIATGDGRTVRGFVAAAFARVGIMDWEGLVHVDPSFVRPADPSDLPGDASRARCLLGWAPTVGFDDLVGRMVDADLAALG